MYRGGRGRVGVVGDGLGVLAGLDSWTPALRGRPIHQPPSWGDDDGARLFPPLLPPPVFVKEGPHVGTPRRSTSQVSFLPSVSVGAAPAVSVGAQSIRN